MEHDQPERRRIVVDGSNIATEGRNLPSLAQLDEAIRSFLDEYKGFATTDVTVVVDASFGHRIDASEVSAFEQAIEHGEMITPPAGAVGRGDGFILRIAEKSGALVLSNDSFQEFHADRPWLFEAGRLIGGKPVPGVGWIFTPRTPVRGAISRSVTSKSKREAKAAEGGDTGEQGESTTVTTSRSRRGRGSRNGLAPTGPMDGVEGAVSGNGSGQPALAVAEQAPKAAKVTKATKASKSTKAVKATKVEKAPKAAKVAKAATSTKVTKATKATKVTKATKATKAAAAARDTHDAADSYDDLDEPAVATRATKATKATKARAAKSATAATVAPAVRASRGGRSEADPSDTGRVPSGEALNDPLTFITFVANHPVGSVFDGTVVSFTSHGAHVEVGGMLCHVPLRGLGDPAPNKARQVLTKGEVRPFELVSLDAPRRRAELVLPGLGG